MSADPADPQLHSGIPRHIAIIMDGNGRWARHRHLPRVAGHRAGVDAVKSVVRACGEKNIQALTLFAFSSENWRRPQEEVGVLMNLFMSALDQQVRKLHENNIRLSIIGDRSAFSTALQERIEDAEALTYSNSGLRLIVAANYGGRWDLVQATRQLVTAVQRGELSPDAVDESMLASKLCLHELPEPDLFIRTGGEKRMSNFLLWHLAYCELYFTDTLWPDFDEQAFQSALDFYACRERRFGRTGEQLIDANSRSKAGLVGS